MSKPLPAQSTFANLAPPWSLTSLDGDFTNVWSAVNDVGTYSNTLTDIGSTNLVIANPPAGITFNLVTGIAVDVVVANTTTSVGPTLNVNGTGAKTIINPDGTALSTAALSSGGIYRFVYDGAFWRIVSPYWQGPKVLIPTSPTSRSSTTTPTNDPFLTQIIQLAGVYEFRLYLSIEQGAAGSIGINTNINYSGTIQNGGHNSLAFGGGTSNATSSPIASAQSTVTFSLATIPTFFGPLWIFGWLQAGSSGTLALAWAQNTSSTNATTVATSSFMIIQRVG